MIHLASTGYSFEVCSAPLAGVSDSAFQKILFQLGCPAIHTEMVSASGLVHQQKKTLKFLNFDRSIHPLIVQVFGADPVEMAHAAKMIEELGADAIDINMGCPVKKVVAAGSGLALMKDENRAYAIMSSVRAAVEIPVSVKVRLGWNPTDFSAVRFSQHAQTAGMNHISVHGRYKTGYVTEADWTAIRHVKQNSSLPVAGNGDVFSVEDAGNLRAQTGCDAIMVGRGILGNPWLPGQIHQHFMTGIMPDPVSLQERFDILVQHLSFLVATMGPIRASYIFRKHAAWYMKGLPGAAQYRKKIFSYTQPEEYYDLVKEISYTV